MFSSSSTNFLPFLASSHKQCPLPVCTKLCLTLLHTATLDDAASAVHVSLLQARTLCQLHLDVQQLGSQTGQHTQMTAKASAAVRQALQQQPGPTRVHCMLLHQHCRLGQWHPCSLLQIRGRASAAATLQTRPRHQGHQHQYTHRHQQQAQHQQLQPQHQPHQQQQQQQHQQHQQQQ